MTRRKTLRLRLSDEVAEQEADFVVTVATKLTPELIDKFCDLIERGLPVDGACDFLSIASSSFWTWIKKGQSFIDGNAEPKEHAIFGHFVQRMKHALAKYRLERIDRLHRSPQWVREMTILERRDRKSFSRMDPPGGAMEEYDDDERFL